MLSSRCTIYVRLVNEPVDVWRPVEAEHVSGNVHLILPQDYDRDSEVWEFEPGDLVECTGCRLLGSQVTAIRAVR